MILKLPPREVETLVETELMKQVCARTLAAHPQGGFIVWSGPSRNGKTVTARWLVAQLNELPEQCNDAFKAVHFEVAKSSQMSNARDEARRAVQRVWLPIRGRLMEGRYRAPAEELSRDLVHSLQAERIEMIFVDEAGGLSLDELRGLMTLLNVAANERHRLSIVLIGMDELPVLVRKLAQIRERVIDTCFFEPYAQDDCIAFLEAMLPHFKNLKNGSDELRKQAQFILDKCHGLPGELAAYCTRARGLILDRGEPITLEALRMLHLVKEYDTKRAIEFSTAHRKRKPLRSVKSDGRAAAPKKLPARAGQRDS